MEPPEIQQLSEIAIVLNRLQTRSDATCDYELMADALIWGDEIPAEAHSEPQKYWVLRHLFRYRTSLILSQPDSKREFLWRHAEEICPNWPALNHDRRSTTLAALYHELKS